MTDLNKLYRTDLNKLYREEGWGRITDAALGIDPKDVESCARTVARWAHNTIARLQIEREAHAALAEQNAESYLKAKDTIDHLQRELAEAQRLQGKAEHLAKAHAERADKAERELEAVQAVVMAARGEHHGLHDYGTEHRPQGAAGRGDLGCRTCQELAALDKLKEER